MNKVPFVMLLALVVSGCGKSIPRDELEKNDPNYAVAKQYCSQCHTLPFGDQHPPAGWPYVVARMEGYMKSAKRMIPTQADHDAIVTYFQNAK